MTKRSRTFLFAFLIAIFLIIVPFLILYPQGYRFDIKNRNLTQVGAFYFEVNPTKAQIYINEERIGETSRFTGSNLSKNFLPQIYDVKIEKEGYIAWEKRLEIKPRHVTQAKHVTLFPTDTNVTSIHNDVLNFWVAPNNSDILLQKRTDNGLWKLTLWDTQTQNEYRIFQSERPNVLMEQIRWSWHSDAYFMRITENQITQTFMQQIDRSTLRIAPTSTSTIATANQLLFPLRFIDERIEYFHFSPFNNDHVIILQGGDLWTLHTKDSQLGNPIAESVLTFHIEENNLYWLDKDGIIWRTQSINAQPEQMSLQHTTLTLEATLRLHVQRGFIFLETPDSFLWLNPEEKLFRKLSSNSTEIRISPDSKKLAYADGNEIYLLYLEAQEDEPQRAKYDRTLLTRLSDHISNLSWYDAAHIIFTAKDAVWISEIDTRDHINTIKLVESNNPSLFWQASTKLLYIHTNKQFKASTQIK